MKKYEKYFNFGKVTPSNNYKKNKRKTISLDIIRNKQDGSLRLRNKINFSLIKSTDNILFNEPDFHLKKVAKLLTKYSFNQIVGATYKDEPLVNLIISATKNLNKKYLSEILKLDFFKSSEIILENYCRYKGKINNKLKSLIILRHAWEHLYDHNIFLKKIFNNFSKNSIFFIEVPCSEKLIKKQDYSMLWEEHVYYFNKNGFLNTLNFANLKVIKFIKFYQKHESILCAICKYDKGLKKRVLRSKKMLQLTKRYKDNFLIKKKIIKKKFNVMQINGEVVCYGASHMLNTFVNIFNLENHISYVVDDNIKKSGKYMFVNNTKIFDFKYMKKNLKQNCIFAINPMTSVKFKKKINYLKSTKISVKSIFDF